MKLNLSIIVVTYNCQKYIDRFLGELFTSLKDHENYEVLLNDNQSTDSTFEYCEKFGKSAGNNLILSETDNIGFAKANNLLIKKSKYDNILLLNPDVFGFYDGFWHSLINKWDQVNPMFIRLLNEDLSIQENVGDELSVRRRIRRILGKVSNKTLSDKVIEVETGIMAFILIPRNCFDKVGLLAEKYFMYAEDHDWFFRARKKGFVLKFDPTLELVHTGGGSAVTKWSNKEMKLVKLNVEKVFIRDHFRGTEKFLLIAINWAQRFL